MRPLFIIVGLFGMVVLAMLIPIGIARRAAAQTQRMVYISGGSVSDIVIANADGSQPKIILEGANVRGGVFWSPDGAWLATTLYVNQGRNIARISANGRAWQILTRPPDSQYDYEVPNWSADSSQLTSIYGFVYRGIQGDIIRQYGLHVIRADGSTEQSLTDVRDEASDPVWSPTGEWIAYVSRLGGLPSIYRIRPDGTQREQLTDETVGADFPVWSPDGQRIAYYVGDVAGRQQVRVMASDGSNQQLLYEFNGYFRYIPQTIAWSPDGQQLAFHVHTGERWQFIVATTIGGAKTQLLVDDIVEAADWSPNGEWIVYSIDSGRVSQLYRIRPDGTDRQQLTFAADGARFPQYAPIADKNWRGGWLALMSTFASGIGYLAFSSVSVLSKFVMFIGSSLSSN